MNPITRYLNRHYHPFNAHRPSQDSFEHERQVDYKQTQDVHQGWESDEVSREGSVCLINMPARRNRNGKVIKPAPFQAKATPGDVSRIEPNSKWFGKIEMKPVKPI